MRATSKITRLPAFFWPGPRFSARLLQSGNGMAGHVISRRENFFPKNRIALNCPFSRQACLKRFLTGLNGASPIETAWLKIIVQRCRLRA
jgi:hypothetical protein